MKRALALDEMVGVLAPYKVYKYKSGDVCVSVYFVYVNLCDDASCRARKAIYSWWYRSMVRLRLINRALCEREKVISQTERSPLYVVLKVPLLYGHP